MMSQREGGPGWRMLVFYAAMVVVIFTSPSILDDKVPVRLDEAPYLSLAAILGVCWLGFLAVKRVDEWRQWDNEERTVFKKEFGEVIYVMAASTFGGLLVCSWIGWDYEALPFFMFGPWALLKLVQYIRRPRKEIWD